jgi:hypothetical protein
MARSIDTLQAIHTGGNIRQTLRKFNLSMTGLSKSVWYCKKPINSIYYVRNSRIINLKHKPVADA